MNPTELQKKQIIDTCNDLDVSPENKAALESPSQKAPECILPFVSQSDKTLEMVRVVRCERLEGSGYGYKRQNGFLVALGPLCILTVVVDTQVYMV